MDPQQHPSLRPGSWRHRTAQWPEPTESAGPGSSWPEWPRSALIANRSPLPMGQLVRSIKREDLAEEAKAHTENAGISSCRLVGSYNWIDKQKMEPCMMIPGKPAKWAPVNGPTQLRLDSGLFHVDRNAARFPSHPMEPAIRALLDEDADMPARVELVACGSTLDSLLGFVAGSADKNFRMLVERVGNTVFLVRREDAPGEFRPDGHEYAHALSDAYTRWDPAVAGSSSSQRLVAYTFGGLRCVVRFEADGYLEEEPTHADGAGDDKPGTWDFTAGDRERAAEEFAEIMSGSGGSPSDDALVRPAHDLEVLRGGKRIDQSRVFDLKARSIRAGAGSTDDVLAAELPRLWVTQIPHLVVAHHDDGVFSPENVDVRDVRDDVHEWQREHNDDLSRLAALLHAIVSVTAGPEGRTGAGLEIYYGRDGDGSLEVRKQANPRTGHAMSAEIKMQWLNGCDVDDDDDDWERPPPAAAMECRPRGMSQVLLLYPWEDGDDWESLSEPDNGSCSEACGYCGNCEHPGCRFRE